MDSTTQSITQTHLAGGFPFLRLPAEIRKMIYELHFAHATLYILPGLHRGSAKPQFLFHPWAKDFGRSSLLLVSKQVLLEAYLAYQHSPQLVTNEFDPSHAMLSAKLDSVRTLHFDVNRAEKIDFLALPNLEEVRLILRCVDMRGVYPKQLHGGRGESIDDLEQKAASIAIDCFEYHGRTTVGRPLLGDFPDGKLPFRVVISLRTLYVKAWRRYWEPIVANLKTKTVVSTGRIGP
jgi:hypothetical protein